MTGIGYPSSLNHGVCVGVRHALELKGLRQRFSYGMSQSAFADAGKVRTE